GGGAGASPGGDPPRGPRPYLGCGAGRGGGDRARQRGPPHSAARGPATRFSRSIVMTAVRSCWPVLLAAAAACADSKAQGHGLKVDARLPVMFTQLSNVVELHGGRIVFADTRDRLFLRADLGTGKVDTIGTRVDSL